MSVGLTTLLGRRLLHLQLQLQLQLQLPKHNNIKTFLTSFPNSTVPFSTQKTMMNHLGLDVPDIWPSSFSNLPILPNSNGNVNVKSMHDSSRVGKYPSLGDVTCVMPGFWARGLKIGGGYMTADKKGATIIDGKEIADVIKSQVADEVTRMKNSIGKCPSLVFVLVGERNDSHTFVEIKMKACEKVGISSKIVELPAKSTEDEVLRAVSDLYSDPAVHGVIVQLPLPDHLNEERIMNVVTPEKDVDGFHPVNMGNLAMKGREPYFIPCGAKACVDVLLRSGIELSGKKAVVIGRSKVVALPTSLLLQRHHATVSVVHSFTKNPQEVTREADIVIADVGVPNMVRGDWLKPGVIVIDAGTNAIKDPNGKHGFHLAGDVCFEEAVEVASAITPVPGGLGPITVSMLLSNTLDSAKRAYKFA